MKVICSVFLAQIRPRGVYGQNSTPGPNGKTYRWLSCIL